MKRLYLFILLAGHTLVSVAQSAVQQVEGLSSDQHSSVYLDAVYDFGSNAITNELIKTYLQNGFITFEMKDKVSDKLNARNRLGGDADISFGCIVHPDSLFKSNNLSYYIGVKDANHIDAAFSKDLFEVYFRGNKNFAGRTADFSNFNYNLLQYQELKLGLEKRFVSDSSVSIVSAGINIVNGQNFQRIEAKNATLFTSADGAFIDANFNLQLNQSDSAHKAFLSGNGAGAAVDLAYKYISNKNYFIRFSVADLGFIRWNNHSTQVTADSTYHFEGIVTNDLFNLNNNIKGSRENLDSTYVQPFLNHRTYKSYTTLLPAIFTLNVGKEIKNFLNGTNMLSLNMNYRINASYVPLTWIELSHESLKHEMIHIDFAYGGYSLFFINAAFGKFFNNGWQIALGFSHIDQMINFNDGRGQGVFVTLRKNFK